MKIKMKETRVCANKYLFHFAKHAFHKGYIYNAFPAINQPDYKTKGLVFAEKANGINLLLDSSEYSVISE